MKTKLIDRINKTNDIYVLRLDRNFDFIPGQYVDVITNGMMREYSIYSGNKDKFLELLIRAVPNGVVSNQLKNAELGTNLEVDGPYGDFTVDNELDKMLFVATGTGISPFRSFVRSYDIPMYKVLHGVRFDNERDPEGFKSYVGCVTRGLIGYQGRVTDYLKEANFTNWFEKAYLCGNCDMINEVTDILTNKGFNEDNIKSEVFF